MIKTELSKLLKDHFDISTSFADSASERLVSCPSRLYEKAIVDYATNEEQTFLESNGFNTDVFQQDYQMDYLNAVLMLVWLETDYKTAIQAIESGYDDIVE